ncbi:MAG: threonine synthase [Alphaproteobacteria bacterium]|nr:MAG: threonine synthase [Alphaproteobacteria bacterium]
MKYHSTRGEAPVLEFEDVLLAGLARDGGLYMPEAWPEISANDMSALAGVPYADLAVRVMSPFVGKALSDTELGDIAGRAYAAFSHPAVAPISQIGSNEFLLELYHGPTLAFKDLAMQMLGGFFDHVLKKRGRQVTIVGATSGDTGGAAIEALRGRSSVSVFILHPHGRVSDVQRRMMTTVPDKNVHNIALDGNFDDCQAIVKALFNDHAFRDRTSLGGVNSINWSRVMAQIVYYFAAGLVLGAPHRAASYAVPTGNFGDILAGYAAKQMGLPVDRLIIATNVNDILARTLATGEYKVEGVTPTTSPSMDIQVSSNFERLIFEACGREAGEVRGLMSSLGQSGAFTLKEPVLANIRKDFDAARADEAEVARTMRETYEASGHLIDPHTAVGLAAGRKVANGASPLVTLSTAHVAKFPDAVKEATGVTPALPSHLEGLMHRDERMSILPNDLGAVRSYIEEHL